MQVTFKLTPIQIKVAKEIVAKVGKETIKNREGDDRSVFCGNLLGYMPTHPCFNEDQDLHFEISEGTVTYNGQRHPLHKDGGMGVLREIAGGDIRRLKVVNYDTTDKRLRWHETMDDFLWSRATMEQLLKSPLFGHKVKLWSEQLLLANVPGAQRLGFTQRHLDLMVEGKERQIQAELDSSQVKFLRVVAGYWRAVA